MSEDPRARLQRWVEEQGSRIAASRLIGCHPTYLSHLIAEGSTRRVGLDVAFGIERATEGWSEGQIMAKEWAVPTEPAEDAPGNEAA